MCFSYITYVVFFPLKFRRMQYRPKWRQRFKKKGNPFQEVLPASPNCKRVQRLNCFQARIFGGYRMYTLIKNALGNPNYYPSGCLVKALPIMNQKKVLKTGPVTRCVDIQFSKKKITLSNNSKLINDCTF